jgi:hypothetical protein
LVPCIIHQSVPNIVKEKQDKSYLVNERMVNLPQVRLRVVRTEGILGAGSLILRLDSFLPTTFLDLGRGGKVAAPLALV